MSKGFYQTAPLLSERRGYRRCGLDHDANRQRMFNVTHGEYMRPQSRFTTVSRVSFPKSVGKAALKAMRMDDGSLNKDHDEFDAEAKRVNAAAMLAANESSGPPLPRKNTTRQHRYRPRVKLGRYFPEHQDKLDLHPLKPSKMHETTHQASFRPASQTHPELTPILPTGYVPMMRRATPPGAYVPGGHRPLPKTDFDAMCRSANARAHMLLPLGNQRPGVARLY